VLAIEGPGDPDIGDERAGTAEVNEECIIKQQPERSLPEKSQL